jgi:murein endopeptidase
MLGLYALLALLSSPPAPLAGAGAGQRAEAARGSADEDAVSVPSDAAISRTGDGPRYTLDLDDAALEKLLRERPEELGSLALGSPESGRLLQAEQFPSGAHWIVVEPAKAYGTRETLDAMRLAVEDVASRLPGPPLRVNHLSKRNGGWLRPHRSHQSGRDVDLGFYRIPSGPKAGDLDLPRDWALVRALVTLTDVQFILVDRRIQKRLFDFARSLGEDPAWLDSLFRGEHPLLRHARGHRDHFHVRFFNPRAQELGARVQPLIAKYRSELYAATHRVRRGESVGGLARRYDSTAAAIRAVNDLKSDLLTVGRTLLVPLSGANLDGSPPPEVLVPARRLPPFNPPMFEAGTPHPTRPPELAQAKPPGAATAAGLLFGGTVRSFGDAVAPATITVDRPLGDLGDQ